MTLMEKYNLILDRIHEACPETMELKFGCRMEYMPRGHIGIYLGLGEKQKVVAYPWGVETIEDKFLKILGTDPTLADVLKTLGKEEKRSVGSFYIDQNGNLLINSTIPFWNLSHDSLSWHRDNQPETIEFLYEILK